MTFQRPKTRGFQTSDKTYGVSVEKRALEKEKKNDLKRAKRRLKKSQNATTNGIMARVPDTRPRHCFREW